MDRRIDLFASSILTVLGAAVVLMSVTAPQPHTMFDRFGPMGVPLIIGISMVAGAVSQSYRTWRNLRTLGRMAPSEGADDEEGFPASARRALGVMVGGMIYVIALIPLGFLLATPLAIAAGLWALNVRRPTTMAVTGIVYTVVAFLIFNQVLSVPLPLGPLGGLLFDLGVLDIVQ